MHTRKHIWRNFHVIDGSFYTAVVPVSQVTPRSAAEEGRRREAMFKAAVSVLTFILLLTLIIIVSLVAFIMWKLRKLRDRSGKKAHCMCMVGVYVTIDALVRLTYICILVNVLHGILGNIQERALYLSLYLSRLSLGNWHSLCVTMYAPLQCS